MKKSITGVVALLAGAFAAHSQGTVSFADYLVLNSYITVTLNGNPVGGSSTVTTGNPVTDIANGSDWSVALYANTGAGDAVSALTPATVDGSGSPGTPVTATLAGGGTGSALGTWFSTTIADVPGQATVGGGAATVAVAAWYNDGGTVTSEAAAVAKGLPGGFSAPGTVAATGGPQPSGPPATAPSLPASLQGTTIGLTGSAVPEPSTIALGVMGASAFLMRLRKKS